MEPSDERSINITWHAVPPAPGQIRAWDLLWQKLLGPVGKINDNTPAAGPPGYRLDASTVTSSAAQLESLISDNTTP